MDYTESEIELLKCSNSSQVKSFIERHSSESNNPFIEEAKIKYDDLFFNENNSSIAELNKYLSKFPTGRHCMTARKKIEDLKYMDMLKKRSKEERKEDIENLGLIICLVLFVVSFAICLINGLSFGESFALQGAFVPVYYTIVKFTEKKD